jgi:transposase
MEPIDYWLNHVYFLIAKGYDVVLVNSCTSKRSKNWMIIILQKTNTKDVRVIAQLIKDGRYSIPNLVEGVYTN